MTQHRVLLVVAPLVLALAAAPAAAAHSGGKAEPRIAASLSGSGLERTVSVRLTDIDDGDPIEGATVTAAASMQRPHAMELAPVPLAEAGGAASHSSPAAPREPPPDGAVRILWSALGAEGAIYVVTVPLILAAAMALRYVHVLNHVAVVLSRGR